MYFLGLHYPSAQLARRHLVIAIGAVHEKVVLAESPLYLEHVRVARRVHEQEVYLPILICNRVLYDGFRDNGNVLGERDGQYA